ncbi:hypothetical protein [Streptomyces indicus]|uniref:Conjugal transfer protein n=1 Tax=Streptomyces indicus TaxID=417292 RepID=A0A1G9ISW8_9ACTN|nr:hypothetical protein [Streptomyces indicus]SDL28297.1 hypothetical protein SAMN05421806_12552 [Streptomyces indicus]
MNALVNPRQLNSWQYAVLGVATALMLAVGAFGGWGTYSNVQAQFHREATAAGVVAAGEGLALVLALTMLCLTMLDQPSPSIVRIGLWLAPVGACATGVMIARNIGEAVVYGITPMAMSGAAEGLGLIARRVNTYRTGIDAEQLRRNADTVQRIAYQQAVAQHHPDETVRDAALRESWKLAEKAGRGDNALGQDLVAVQRQRLRDGADAALSRMYGRSEPAPAAAASRSAQEVLRRRFAEMDPAEVIRIADEAQPGLPPAELAAQLVGYGVVVDAVQVALVLHGGPSTTTVERAPQQGATPVAPQVGPPQPALTKSDAIRDVAVLLGPDAPAKDIVAEVAAKHRIDVEENAVRAVLSRTKRQSADKAKEPRPEPDPRIGQGGEGYN